MLIIASVVLVLVTARSRRPRLMASRAGVDLPAVYASIRRQANDMATSWPAAMAVASKCVRAPGGKLQPPAFDDGHGPIGAYAMLSAADNLAVLRWCRSAFEKFIVEYAAVLATEEQKTAMANDLWMVEEQSWHTCVTVFHEHPSLLKADERSKWRAVDDALASQLAEAVRSSTRSLAQPQLTLDSLCICADGAMIAGFRDDPDGSFAALRAASAASAVATLGGALTSRPKALIHVTLGRLLGASASLTEEQRGRIGQLVRQYNQIALPAMVEALTPQQRQLRVATLSLARDSVWWMTDYQLHGTWELGRDD